MGIAVVGMDVGVDVGVFVGVGAGAGISVKVCEPLDMERCILGGEDEKSVISRSRPKKACVLRKVL